MIDENERGLFMRGSAAALGWIASILTATPALPEATSSGNVAAGSLVIAGYPLGRPLTMAACPRDKLGISKFSDKPPPCWTPESPDGEVRRVWWPMGATPLGTSMKMTVRQGILIGVDFGTSGVQDEDRVLAQLTEKFGKPTALNAERMQNVFGMKFLKYFVVWDLANAYVEFESPVEGAIDQGGVTIMTPKEHSKVMEYRRSMQAPKF